MYTPKPFKQDNLDTIFALITHNPLAILITKQKDGTIDAHHVPLFLDKEQNRLLGHIAKANSLWRKIAEESEALIIFNGSEHYITPNWYPSKKINEKAVPTWNYITAHLRGHLTFIHDDNWKLNMLTCLTVQQENKIIQKQPWRITDAPTEYISNQLKAIIGIEISITSIEAKWKISQNKTAEDKQGILNGLADQNTENAQCMRQEIIKVNK